MTLKEIQTEKKQKKRGKSKMITAWKEIIKHQERRINPHTFLSNSIYGDNDKYPPNNLVNSTLEFVNLYIDNTPIKCIKDSGKNLFTVNKESKHISKQKYLKIIS